MSDPSTPSTPTGSPPTSVDAGPDPFSQFQIAVAHALGHPRLREIAAALGQEEEHDQDPRQVFLDHGVALPANATVDFDGAEADSEGLHLCFGSPDGHSTCVTIVLPHIHF